MKVAAHISELVGGTPLVRLSTVALSPAVTVLSRTSGVPPTSSEMCPATFMPPSPGGLEADQGEHEDADQRDPEDGEDGGPDEPRSGGRPRTEVPAGDAAEGGKGADVERTDPHGGRDGLHPGTLARDVQGEREDRVAPEHTGDQPRGLSHRTASLLFGAAGLVAGVLW